MRLYDVLYTLAVMAREKFPVGAVYTSAIELTAEEVGDMFGGTWEQIGKGRVLMGAGALDDNTSDSFGSVTRGEIHVEAGVRGGTATSSLPRHTHVQDEHTHIQDAHNHSQTAHNHSQNAHRHAPNHLEKHLVYSGDVKGDAISAASGTGYKIPKIDKDHTWGGSPHTTYETATNVANKANILESRAVNQNAVAVNQETGVNPEKTNLQPFETVFFFKRIA